MAKDKGKSGPKVSGKIPKEIAGIKIPKALRSSGNAALKLAQTPAARELLSAGLLAAAAAVTANSRTRKATQDGVKDASRTLADVTGALADNAGKIGAAFVGAAAEAAQRLFDDGAAAAKAEPEGNPVTTVKADAVKDVSVADKAESVTGDASRKPPVKRPRPAGKATNPPGKTNGGKVKAPSTGVKPV